jgi:hypothetical protein
MAGHAIRAWRWSALLQLLFATALPGPHAQPTAADAGPQAPGSPSADGSHLGSRLMPPKSERSCSPKHRPDVPGRCDRHRHGHVPAPMAMRVARGNYLALKLSLSRRRDIA